MNYQKMMNDVPEGSVIVNNRDVGSALRELVSDIRNKETLLQEVVSLVNSQTYIDDPSWSDLKARIEAVIPEQEEAMESVSQL